VGLKALEMDATKRLLNLADALPVGGVVQLDARALRRLAGVQADDEPAQPGAAVVVVDFTVEQVAEKLGRSASTIRGWLHAGVLRGYKLREREWRVPPAALAELQASAADEEPAIDSEPVNLSGWRRHYAGRQR
jgi:excisionase family DNA binding protein